MTESPPTIGSVTIFLDAGGEYFQTLDGAVEISKEYASTDDDVGSMYERIILPFATAGAPKGSLAVVREALWTTAPVELRIRMYQAYVGVVFFTSNTI